MTEKDVEIVETLLIKKGRYTVVIGFGGPGFVGCTAVMNIAHSMNLKQHAYMKSQLVPPMMMIIDGRPRHAFRIYVEEEKKFILVTSEMLLTTENAWPIGRELINWLLDKGAKTFISIEGMPFGAVPSERKILGFSTDKKDLVRFDIRPTMEGAVSGLNACLLEESLNRGLSYTVFFVPTDLVSAIDYGGAAAVIEVLNQTYQLGVDVTPLRQRDEMVRRVMTRGAKGEPRSLLDALRRRI